MKLWHDFDRIPRPGIRCTLASKPDRLLVTGVLVWVTNQAPGPVLFFMHAHPDILHGGRPRINTLQSTYLCSRYPYSWCLGVPDTEGKEQYLLGSFRDFLRRGEEMGITLSPLPCPKELEGN